MTTTSTLTLTEFLLVRLDEDEARAQGGSAWPPTGAHWGDCDLVWVADHHSPECTCTLGARVLAEVAAKRAIIGIHRTDNPDGQEPICNTCLYEPPCETLRALASVYADHPDYRSEWRVG